MSQSQRDKDRQTETHTDSERQKEREVFRKIERREEGDMGSLRQR